MSHSVIPLRQATLCANCSTVSDATTDICPGCGSRGGLLSLARILNPSPELGQVTFVLASRLPDVDEIREICGY